MSNVNNSLNVKPSVEEPKTFYLDGKRAITYGNYLVIEHNAYFCAIYTADDYYKKELVYYFRNWYEAVDIAHNLQLAYDAGYDNANRQWTNTELVK